MTPLKSRGWCEVSFGIGGKKNVLETLSKLGDVHNYLHFPTGTQKTSSLNYPEYNTANTQNPDSVCQQELIAILSPVFTGSIIVILPLVTHGKNG